MLTTTLQNFVALNYPHNEVYAVASLLIMIFLAIIHKIYTLVFYLPFFDPLPCHSQNGGFSCFTGSNFQTFRRRMPMRVIRLYNLRRKPTIHNMKFFPTGMCERWKIIRLDTVKTVKVIIMMMCTFQGMTFEADLWLLY